MNPAAINFAISFLIATFLSGENRHTRCFTGLEPSLTSILCSANSLRTHDSEDIFVVPKKVGEREFLFLPIGGH
jgi:hypothetical protein